MNDFERKHDQAGGFRRDRLRNDFKGRSLMDIQTAAWQAEAKAEKHWDLKEWDQAEQQRQLHRDLTILMHDLMREVKI